MSWLVVAGFGLGAVLSWAVYRPVIGLLQAAGATRPNYAGRPVPVAGGLVFVLAALLAQTVQWVVAEFASGRGYPLRLLEASSFTLVGFALLGLLDDLLGSRETGGFGGHFRLLLREGRLTSGAVKALGGAVVAAWPALVALPPAGGAPTAALWPLAAVALVNLLLVALTANAVNLLDLRPGRALKGFFLLWVVGLVFSRGGHPAWIWVAPLAGAAAAFGLHDLRAEVMMGDTGANVLGALVGAGVAWSWRFGPRLVWLAVLLAFHLYTERASLSAAIERIAVLRWLDRLGRPAEREDGLP